MTKKVGLGKGGGLAFQRHNEWRICPRPSFYAGSLWRELPSRTDLWTLPCVRQGLGQ